MSDPARRGLGRGLSALLSDGPVQHETGPAFAGERWVVATPAPAPAPTAELSIRRIRPNPDQPRRRFDEAELGELAASVRDKGVLQPLLVRPVPGEPGEYQIVAGERRWRAAKRAGLATVPVVVRELSDLEVLEIGVIENVQRADLNPIEEAQGYRALIDRFGRTQEEVARTVGKSRSHVANALRLLALPEGVLEHVLSGRLTAGHARAVANVPDVERLAQRIVDGGLSVRQAEALARADDRPDRPKSAARPAAPPAKDADLLGLEQDLSETLGVAVVIEDRGGRGHVQLAYADLHQLDEICRLLMRE